MRNFILCLLFCILSSTLYAQEDYNREFGRVTNYEMQMKELPGDKDAEAVVISDVGKYQFVGEDNKGFVLYMTREVKIKILKEAGLTYGTFEVPYYKGEQDWEDISQIEGVTYNYENNTLTKTPLLSSNIFDEKKSEDVRVKKIALANVRVGSVVELSYLIRTPYFFHMRAWNFQRKIPVLYSRLFYKAIPYYSYTYIAKGLTKMDVLKTDTPSNEMYFGNLKYKELEYEMGMNNVPAFRDEEFITSDQDYMQSLNFQLSTVYYPTGGKKEIMTTWPQLCTDLWNNDDFGKYMKNVEKEAKKILPELQLTNLSPLEQIKKIYNYVKTNYSWNGFYGKYAEVNLSMFMKQRKGNVGNVNLFLSGLLRAAGLEAYPVILSTRENGAVSKNHPFQQFFNYVLAAVWLDGGVVYLDGTEPYLACNDLPERCVNVEGLALKPKSPEWVLLSQKKMSLSEKILTIQITESGQMLVNAIFRGKGYDAYRYRSIYKGETDNLSDYLLKQCKIQATDLKADTVTEPERPFLFSFGFTTVAEENSGKLYVQPFCNLNVNKNPFKQTTRSLPVDMVYLKGDVYRSEITIPKGYKVEYIPEKMEKDDELMHVDYNVFNNNGKLFVTAAYNLNKVIYDAKEYGALKAGFNEMIKKFTDMIVLVKE